MLRKQSFVWKAINLAGSASRLIRIFFNVLRFDGLKGLLDAIMFVSLDNPESNVEKRKRVSDFPWLLPAVEAISKLEPDISLTELSKRASYPVIFLTKDLIAETFERAMTQISIAPTLIFCYSSDKFEDLKFSSADQNETILILWFTQSQKGAEYLVRKDGAHQFRIGFSKHDLGKSDKLLMLILTTLQPKCVVFVGKEFNNFKTRYGQVLQINSHIETRKLTN